MAISTIPFQQMQDEQGCVYVQYRGPNPPPKVGTVAYDILIDDGLNGTVPVPMTVIGYGSEEDLARQLRTYVGRELEPDETVGTTAVLKMVAE